MNVIIKLCVLEPKYYISALYLTEEVLEDMCKKSSDVGPEGSALITRFFPPEPTPEASAGSLSYLQIALQSNKEMAGFDFWLLHHRESVLGRIGAPPILVFPRTSECDLIWKWSNCRCNVLDEVISE